jgi:hypothetical protein
MKDRDYTPASDFLTVHKAVTTGAVRLVSFTNDDGEGPAKPLFTRDPQQVDDHCRKWGRLGRGMFVSMCTIMRRMVTQHDLHK